jgi:hypothetical protein
VPNTVFLSKWVYITFGFSGGSSSIIIVRPRGENPYQWADYRGELSSSAVFVGSDDATSFTVRDIQGYYLDGKLTVNEGMTIELAASMCLSTFLCGIMEELLALLAILPAYHA